MKKQTNFDPVIRHQTGHTSHLIRIIILIALWIFVALVVCMNIAFKLGIYSDSLVSIYLLLNLTPHANDGFLALIGCLLIIAPIYCIYRWIHIKKEGHA
ncbi:hypothetical protein [Levilactobacillus yonginensis]|uniref:hypothetical protein n=1 Tax=Levilactobacillus yonginensis TaxID=1054041 RepID=UPI00345D98F9